MGDQLYILIDTLWNHEKQVGSKPRLGSFRKTEAPTRPVIGSFSTFMHIICIKRRSSSIQTRAAFFRRVRIRRSAIEG